MKLNIRRETIYGEYNYTFYKGDLPIGFGQLRLHPTKSPDLPDGFENHIYYEVFDSFRCQGLGKEILAYLVRECLVQDIVRVRLSCAKSNAVSRHIIEWCGGDLVDEGVAMSGTLFRLYQI